jgi:hypothetical protein
MTPFEVKGAAALTGGLFVVIIIFTSVKIEADA